MKNIEINVKEIVDYIEMNCYNRDTIGLHHPSMHQDLILNNRLTEIDYINGAVVRKGKKIRSSNTLLCLFNIIDSL